MSLANIFNFQYSLNPLPVRGRVAEILVPFLLGK